MFVQSPTFSHLSPPQTCQSFDGLTCVLFSALPNSSFERLSSLKVAHSVSLHPGSEKPLWRFVSSSIVKRLLLGRNNVTIYNFFVADRMGTAGTKTSLSHAAIRQKNHQHSKHRQHIWLICHSPGLLRRKLHGLIFCFFSGCVWSLG